MQDNAIAPRSDTKNRLLALIDAALADYLTEADLDADLQALAALSTTGLAARTGDGTWATRTLTAPAAGITVANGGGVAGNPTLSLANDLAALEGLGTTGLAVRTASDTWQTRSLTQPAAGLTITNADGVSGSPTFALANDLAALEGLGGTGLAARTGTDTWASRSLTQPAAGLTITNADGVSGSPTFALANDLAALEGLGGTGLAARTGSDTWASRTLTAPAAGITISNPDGVSGNPTLALANDLAALEALSGTGLAARTGSDTWASRTLQNADGLLSLSNADGVSGNPDISLGDNGLKKAVVTVTNAEILALRASPKTLVAAPGAGKILELVAAFGYCNTAAGAYTNPQQCAIRDNNSTGAVRSGSTATNFVNTTTPTYAYVAAQNCAPVVNVLLCLHNTGGSEMTGGNAANSMTWHVYYRILTLP